MTMTASPLLRWWQKALLALGILAALGLLTAWLLTTAAFWQQVGWRLVAELQNRVNGQVSVGKISGNLVTGMVFEEVTISRPQGDILRIKQLEISLSLFSFFKLQPVIRTLVFRQPELLLRQDPAGDWNVANLLIERPPPPFTQIHLAGIKVIDGYVRVDRPRQQLTFQDLTAQIDLTIQAPGRPLATVQVHQGSFGFTSPTYPPLQAQLALTWSAKEIHLDKSELSLGGHRVLSLQGKLVNLAKEPEITLDLKVPELTGLQIHQIWPRWPTGLSFQAGLQARGSLANLQVTGQGALKDCQWEVSGQWRQNTVANPEYDLTLNFHHLTDVVLSAWKHPADLIDALSPVNGTLYLSGTGLPWPPEKLQARLAVQPFTYRQAKVETASVTARLERERLHHLALKLQGNFGRLEAEANGQLWQVTSDRATSAGDLKVLAGGLNPSLLLGQKAPAGSLEVKFDGDFQVPPVFNWPQARLTGKLQTSGKLKDYAFQEFSVQGSWEAGELRLNPARLTMSSLRAEAQGRLSPTDTDLKLVLDLLPPGPWPLMPPDFKGQFRADGTVKGHWQSLNYQLNFQGKSLSWRNLALALLQGKTAGTASREAFTISNFDLLAQKLSTPVGQFGQIQGRGQTQGGNLVFDLKAQQSPGHSGALTGMVTWEKNGAQIKISQFHWGPPDFQVVAAEPVTLSLAPGRFEISPCHLRFQKAILSLAGGVSSDNLSLHAKLENLQLADITRLLPQMSPFQGTINAQADLSGTGRAPVMNGHLKLAPGQIGKFAFDYLQTDWLYQGNVLTVNGQMVEKPDKARLSWQGTAPLTFTLLPWTWHLPDSGLQLRVWSDNLNLSLLAQLFPGISASDGPMQLQAQISGSLHQPLLSGSLRYGPGSLTIRPSGAPLAIDQGEIRLEGDRLTFNHAIFHSGDGQGDITGGARLESFKLSEVNLNLVATDLLIIKQEGSRAVASGRIALTGSWPNFRTEGHLTVNSGQFRLSFFRPERHKDIVLLPRVCSVPETSASSSGAATVVRNFTVNLVIDIPGNVWLRDKDINAELEGQIKVLRQPPGPNYLGGWLKAKQGSFALNNKIFTIEKASLMFPGEPHKPILLDARAERQVDEYKLYLVASGPVDNPRTRLESNPPLSPRDQLSLMVFDHLADKMTREEYVSATQKATGVLGSLTAQKLKTLLGNELPFLGEVSPTTSQETVGVGKKLGKDISVSYERKLAPLQGEDLNQIRLDYKFNKYFSAESQLGRRNTGGDLFFNIDF